jgi:hypothetical protein
MGLDMYLNKYPRYKDAKPDDIYTLESYLEWKGTEYEKKHTFEEWCRHSESEIRPDFLKFYTPYYTQNYSTWDTEHKYGYGSIIEQVGYWRKSNQIHNWFVENVQNGVDDCGAYEVNEYQLQELLDLCKRVQDKAVMVHGQIKNGESLVNGKWEPIYEEGDYIENSDEIAELLPSCEGFFFGGTGYDEYYMNDIKNTIKILEKVLEETDFEKEAVFYHASW